MKKQGSLLLAILFVVMVFAGCEKKAISVGGAADGLGDEVYTIRIGCGHSDVNAMVLGLKRMEEYVEKASNGKVQIDIYPNSQLGDEVVALAQVQDGTLEMCTASFAPLATYSRYFTVMDIPFLFNSSLDAWMALDSDIGSDLFTKMEADGLAGMAYMENGFRHVTNNVKPIETMSDFKGLKIRTMESPAHVAAFRSLGSNPTPMAFNEMYLALQQNVLEGQENPISTVSEQKINEVQDYCSKTGHLYDSMVLIANLDWFNTLPIAYQTIVKSGALLGQNYSRFITVLREENFEQQLINRGMAINELSQEAKEELRATSQPVVIEMIKKQVDSAYVDAFLAAIEKCRDDVAKGL